MDSSNSRSSVRNWRDELSFVRKFYMSALLATGGNASGVDHTNPNDPRAFGIDLSAWNGTRNWSEIAAYKPKIIFAGFRASLSNYYRDPTFAASMDGAKSAGILRMAYHYFYPNVSISAQIDLFVSVLAGVVPEIGIVADFEYTAGLSYAEVSRVSELFIKGIRDRTGIRTIGYSRATYINPVFNGSTWWKNFDWWLANYLSSGDEHPGPPLLPPGMTTYLIHQTGSKGSIPGVESLDVDHNRWNGDARAVYAYCGIPYPEPPNLPADEKLNRLWLAHPELWYL